MKSFERLEPLQIEKGPNQAKIHFGHLELSRERPNSPEIKIIVEKQPITVNEGESYAGGAIRIDAETPKVHELVVQAEIIRELPEEQRPATLLNLLSKHVQYAYRDTLETLAETDPDHAEWVRKNTGLDSQHVKNVPLSEFIEHGYGICGHLSVAYLYLAQKAGLEGCFMGSVNDAIKNIEKNESGERLFKSTEVGSSVVAHSWVEVKLKNGRWIPVDPTTKLVGDTPENLELFRQANYSAIGYGVETKAIPDELAVAGAAPIFKPGEATAETSYHLYPKSMRPRLGISRTTNPNTSSQAAHYSGKAEMDISTGSEVSGMKLALVGVKQI